MEGKFSSLQVCVANIFWMTEWKMDYWEKTLKGKLINEIMRKVMKERQVFLLVRRLLAVIDTSLLCVRKSLTETESWLRG